MKNSILNELQKVNSSDFYISGKIPKDKLKNAISNYPIPAAEDVLALIDATVFGSAKNGMAIGLKGIYWKNDWTTDTVKNFLHWNDLIANTKQITTKGSDLILSPGCVCSLAGSSVKSKLLLDLLLSIIEKISKNNEQKLEIPLTDNSQKSPTKQSDDSLKNKKEIEPTPITEKVISQPIVDSRFSGKYDRNLLRLVGEISKKYRLSRHVYIAPSIQVNKAKTILDLCNDSIDPFSILVIVDNTFLQTGKDFLIVTNEFVMSKGMMRKLDKFDLLEIRNISCDNDNFFINNYEFQFFDQLKHSETRIIVDFLNELIPLLSGSTSKSNNGVEDVNEYRGKVSYIEDIFLTVIMPITFQAVEERGDTSHARMANEGLKGCFDDIRRLKKCTDEGKIGFTEANYINDVARILNSLQEIIKNDCLDFDEKLLESKSYDRELGEFIRAFMRPVVKAINR